MKILFIENRYKTFLWEKIGSEFIKRGHEIYFIVQNHAFKPKDSSFNVHAIKYPKASIPPLTEDDQTNFNKVILSNRGLNYFGIKEKNFIKYYAEAIEKIITTISPDFVFGESTLFHELLVIESCKKRDILYLHPSSSRYPKNRFAFYKYDTLEPYKGSLDSLNEDEALSLANRIGKRESLPDYMSNTRKGPAKSDLILDKVRLSLAYFRGERYNTPSPLKKKQLSKIYANYIETYESIAKTEISDLSGTLVMYPMQMQPEANIDVWGFPNNQQHLVVEKIAKALNENQFLILKPNPKSKYEIDADLLSVIKKYPTKIIALSHKIGMDTIWDKINLVITVTGTASIECVFANKPVAMFGEAIQTKQKNCIKVSSIEDIKSVLRSIEENSFPKLNDKELADFLNELMRTSYEGINGDGLHNRSYLETPENWNNLKTAFLEIVEND